VMHDVQLDFSRNSSLYLLLAFVPLHILEIYMLVGT
jgi:hypothetical protein